MPFTPVQTFLGGLLLHLSTATLLNDTGRVLGISGIVDGALLGKEKDRGWRWATLTGLLAGPVVIAIVGAGEWMPDNGVGSWVALERGGLGRLLIAGGLVGFGSRLGSGCTSGHMLCGVSRLSPRSIVATFTFCTTAVLATYIFPAPLESQTSPAYTLHIPTASVTTGLITILAIALTTHLGFRQYLLSYTSKRSPNNQKQTPSPRYIKHIPYFLSGLTFSLGLLVSGMVSPIKVISFLRPFPPFTLFDPSLAMVILGGVIPNAIHYNLIKGKHIPKLSWEKWSVPSKSNIDIRLVVGAGIFGVGWGLAGVCPGPAIVGLSQVLVSVTQGFSGLVEKQVGWLALKGVTGFLGGMIGGMAAANVL